MPVPSQGHYGFHSFPVVDWFCLESFEKGMIYKKILKIGGGSREKGGGGNEIHAPCACGKY
jgi:hypothetical protein